MGLEVLKAYEELCKTPGYVKPKGKLEGDQKVALLARVITGPLREITSKGKVAGQIYVKPVLCNFADLQGEDRGEELKRQKEKAKKKGITAGVEKKWFWCWYEDKKNAEKRQFQPDGYIPLGAVASVHRSPERNDQFVVKYSEDGEKKNFIFRREAGKGLDVWVEGIDMASSECRKMIKGKKEGKEQEEKALKRMQEMHKQWVQKNGAPSNEQQWTAWFQFFKSNNYDDALIKKFYTELTTAKPAKKK